MDAYNNPLESFDLTNISTQNKQQLIPEGWYVVEITDGGIRRSKKGTDYLFFQLTIRDDTPLAGKTVGLFFFLWSEPNEQSLKMYKAFRLACGLDATHGGHVEEALGRRIMANIAVKTDSNGVQSNKVKACGRLPDSPWGD